LPSLYWLKLKAWKDRHPSSRLSFVALDLLPLGAAPKLLGLPQTRGRTASAAGPTTSPVEYWMLTPKRSHPYPYFPFSFGPAAKLQTLVKIATRVKPQTVKFTSNLACETENRFLEDLTLFTFIDCVFHFGTCRLSMGLHIVAPVHAISVIAAAHKCRFLYAVDKSYHC
jgi:hypothetical protein